MLLETAETGLLPGTVTIATANAYTENAIEMREAMARVEISGNDYDRSSDFVRTSAGCMPTSLELSLMRRQGASAVFFSIEYPSKLAAVLFAGTTTGERVVAETFEGIPQDVAAIPGNILRRIAVGKKVGSFSGAVFPDQLRDIELAERERNLFVGHLCL